jgi:transcriptional regulator with XRE-family HTH domain
MTNTKKLKAAFAINGISQRKIAQDMNLSYYTFNKKVNNKSEFKASEIDYLSTQLNLSEKDSYFFARKVDL